MSRGDILILDDEKNIVIVLTAILEKRGFRVVGFTEPAAALDTLSRRSFDTIVTDLFMPEMNGIEFLKAAKSLLPETPVVVITAFGAVETAVDAIKAGAFDYVTKPFEQSEIANVVDKAVSTKRLASLELISGGASAGRENTAGSNGEWSESSLLLRGKSPRLAQIFETIEKLAPLPSTVLILGESGVGKEILVEELHRRSPRGKHPLVRLNSAAVPAEALDQEIFGSENRPGRLELAHESTFFLDEISALPLPTQVRLSEFLDSGRVERRRDGIAISLDVRVIAASSIDLSAAVASERFSDALYFALNVAPIHLPSLADRQEDIPDLVEVLRERLSKKLGRSVPRFSTACNDAFAKLPWPGNLRQLERVMERMILVAPDVEILDARDIPSDLLEQDSQIEPGLERFREIVKRKTQDLERDFIELALKASGDNVTKAAKQLKISRKGLQNKMKDLGFR